MARKPRVAVPGYPHHITQRGNRKAIIFFDDMDRHVYLRLLVEQCKEKGVRVWAYSLMSNHVHFVAVPEEEHSLSRGFQRIHGDYAQYFNAKYLKNGHLWQGRFKSSLLDDRYLYNAVRYVERNPVRAGLVRRAEDYRWSSAATHCGLRADRVLANDLPLIEVITDWSEWLGEPQEFAELEVIRARTRTGRPCASDEFTRALELRLGRKLLPQKSGPRKTPTEPQAEPGLFAEEFGD